MARKWYAAEMGKGLPPATEDVGWDYQERHLERWGWANCTLPKSLTRAEYEARCRAAGLDPIPDEDLALRFNDWMIDGAHDDNPDDRRVVVWSVLSGRRILGIRRENPPPPRAPVPEPPIVAHCAVCGIPLTAAMAMSASLGTTCPDHYDELSD